MACDRCGYTSCYTSLTCPRCNPTKPSAPNPNTGKAAEEAGKGIANGLLWLAGNKVLAFVWVWVACVIVIMIIGKSIGIVPEITEETPGWFFISAFIAPLILIYPLRRYITKYIPKLLTFTVSAGLMLIYAAFIIFICTVAIKMCT